MIISAVQSMNQWDERCGCEYDTLHSQRTLCKWPSRPLQGFEPDEALVQVAEERQLRHPAERRLRDTRLRHRIVAKSGTSAAGVGAQVRPWGDNEKQGGH